MYHFIDKKRRLCSFELFGYDFMIDEQFEVYLIEANINPCLSVTSPFSSRFITALVDNTLRFAVDPLFPPPQDFSARKFSVDILPEIRYELVFDQRVDGAELNELYKTADLSIVRDECVGELNGEKDTVDDIIEEDYPDEEAAT